MRVSSVLVFLLGIFYWASPILTKTQLGPETAVSTALGAVIACLAVLSSFRGATGARYINVVIGLALMLSPAVLLWSGWNVTMMIVQGVVGVLTLGLSLLETFKPGDGDRGWRRVWTRKSDENYLWS